MTLLEQYKEKQKKISYLVHAASLMNWDKETTTPQGGMEKLAEAINYFQTEIFKLSTSDETFDLVCKLAEPEEFNKLDDVMQFDIKRSKRDLEKMRKLPQEVFEEYVKATTKASIVWPSAKRASDFSKFEKERNKDIFETMPVPLAVRTMALPTILSQLIVLIYNMADTFYLGRTNNPYMVAGVSLILRVFNICLSLAGLSGIGGGALISRLLGAGEPDEAERVSAFSLYLAAGTTAFFSVGMLLFMDPILQLLGASGNTLAYARQYSFCVIVLGEFPR
jgi:hypothetical protein